MIHIRPISYLRNSLADISRESLENEVYCKLKEAKSTAKRYSHEEVFSDLRSRLTIEGDDLNET